MNYTDNIDIKNTIEAERERERDKNKTSPN